MKQWQGQVDDAGAFPQRSIFGRSDTVPLALALEPGAMIALELPNTARRSKKTEKITSTWKKVTCAKDVDQLAVVWRIESGIASMNCVSLSKHWQASHLPKR